MRSVQSTLFALLVASGSTFADTTLNLTRGVSPISRDVYELHMIVFWICVVIGLSVFGVMFYSMFYHRKSRGAKPANFHSHPVLEVIWTIIPIIILVVMAIPATKVLFKMNNEEMPALTIKITGYQWQWHYEYIEDDIRFFSNLSTPADQLHNLVPKGANYLREVDHPLVVPIHKKIRFLITSNDVNHAWWVPALGVKRDAIGGVINEAWTKIDKPGTYYGQCAELCGVNHAFMPIVVIATTEEGYKEWVAKQKGEVTQGAMEANRTFTMQELMANGEKKSMNDALAAKRAAGSTPPKVSGENVTTPPPVAATAKVATATAAPEKAAALSPEEAMKAAMERGEKVYESTCAVCHQPAGTGVPPTFPALKGGKITTGPVDAHINQVMNGKPGTAMQAFKDRLNDQEIADVVTYERNAWGNNMGTLVKPEDIKAARQNRQSTTK